MKKRRWALGIILVAFLMIGLISPISTKADINTHTIVLDSTENTDGTWFHHATIDGSEVDKYDRVWHADPSTAHNEVKDAPAEYYTGTKPGDDAVYIAHDIYYYPKLPAENFVRVNYDGSQEWAYYYTADGYTDYIFATLPVNGSSVPVDMMHSEEEAYENAVLHITKAGTYILEGNWHGQIWIDLGDPDETFVDSESKVTITLNGVNVTCTVAPALIFYSAYECDNTWEERGVYTALTDTSRAGANVLITDGTENNFTGTNIYRMLKAKYKDEEPTGTSVQPQKKMRKTDAAFYSYVSMNVGGGPEGTGILNINSGFEGLDTELHLTMNGGRVNIFSQDDGINVNEDGVSVVTFNGGVVHILAGLGSEGDGVDSNGFLVINGGTVISLADPRADSGLDSDCGSYINGGTVVALGSTMDWVEADDSNKPSQVTMNLQFANVQNSDEAIILTDVDGKVIFAYDSDKDEVSGARIRNYRGAILSSPILEKGKDYYVYVGGDVYGVEDAGLYDISTITGFSDDARQQCFSGTWENSGKPGLGGFPDERPPEPPEGFGDGQPPESPGGFGNGQPPELPGGFGGGQPPEPPAGFGGGQPPEPPGGFGGGQSLEPPKGFDGEDVAVSTLFRMVDMVNNFSRVSDYDELATGTFVDVRESDLFFEAIKNVTDKGLMSGISATEFSPDTPATRATIVQALYHMENNPEISGVSLFEDVSPDAKYKDAVEWAKANALISGYSDYQFGPDDSVTFEQLAVILYRYAQYKKMDAVVSVDTNMNVLDASPYAVSAMRWAYGTGIFEGLSNSLMPKNEVTRAQVAAILYWFSENVG